MAQAAGGWRRSWQDEGVGGERAQRIINRILVVVSKRNKHRKRHRKAEVRVVVVVAEFSCSLKSPSLLFLPLVRPPAAMMTHQAKKKQRILNYKPNFGCSEQAPKGLKGGTCRGAEAASGQS